MLRLIFICFVLAVTGYTQIISFHAASRNRNYTVTTSAVGPIASTSGRWMYQPSLLTPSVHTGNKWALLYSANRVKGKDLKSDAAIYLSTSNNATFGYSSEVEVLRMSAVNNICDMIGARPIWVDELGDWFVFLQALEGTYTSGCNYPAGSQGRGAIVIAAHGPTLNQLSWITNGSGGALAILHTSRPCIGGACGIGEQFQVFNVKNYGGPQGFPIMVVYNDWSYSSGGQQFTYLSPSVTGPWSYWSNVSPAYAPPGGSATSLGTPNPYRGIREYPDLMLAQSADESTLGNPGFAVADGCDTRSYSGPFNYGTGLGYFPDPVHTNRIAQDGIAVFGGLSSVSSDSYGPRMFRPRLARNEYGYITPSSTSPRIWNTYVVYNDLQTGTSSDRCGYGNWNSTQRFSISTVSIMEQ